MFIKQTKNYNKETHVTPSRLALCYVLIFLLAYAHCRGQKTDTLYFKNGAVLPGELKSMKLGYIEFDATDIGIMKIKNSKLKTISAHTTRYRIETLEKNLIEGTLWRSQIPGMVVIVTSEEKILYSIVELGTLAKLGNNWAKRFNGKFGLGYSYTKSSDVGRLNVNGELNHTLSRSETYLNLDMIVTSDSGVVSRDREYSNLAYFYGFDNFWDVGGLLRYQRNVELGLKKRWQEGVMIGRKLIVEAKQRAKLLVGVATNQETNFEDEHTENVEMLLQFNYYLFSFENPNLQITLGQSGYLSLSQKGRYRWDGNSTANWELKRNLYLNLQFYHNYDSKPPEESNAKIDYGVVFGVNYKF